MKFRQKVAAATVMTMLALTACTGGRPQYTDVANYANEAVETQKPVPSAPAPGGFPVPQPPSPALPQTTTPGALRVEMPQPENPFNADNLAPMPPVIINVHPDWLTAEEKAILEREMLDAGVLARFNVVGERTAEEQAAGEVVPGQRIYKPDTIILGQRIYEPDVIIPGRRIYMPNEYVAPPPQENPPTSPRRSTDWEFPGYQVEQNDDGGMSR